MSIESILAGLDRSQRRAATAGRNAAVAAGAGAGKTMVLASRYAWLVMEKKYRVNEILALTFTNKAAGEMYSRIYQTLRAESGSGEAREAVAGFSGAKITTIDSFCASVVRAAARYYGLSPEFAIDDDSVRELVMEAALPFVLDHRDNPALQTLLADRNVRAVAEDLFAETALKYSPLGRPIDFEKYLAVQIQGLLDGWKKKTAQALALVDELDSAMETVSRRDLKMDADLRGLLGKERPRTPDLGSLEEITPELKGDVASYFEWLSDLASVGRRGGGGEYDGIKANIGTLKDSLCGELQSIANTALQIDVVESVFSLMDEFQILCGSLKRKAGLLAFGDIACLAVNALAEYPDLRKVYKDEIKSIMIDEFQDNNSLQKDLVFLLAEDPLRMERGIPGPESLSEGKVFFVGDEKQSIYRFRGADVTVFRGLAEGLNPLSGPARPGPPEDLSLVYNYRSAPALVTAFNRVFGGIGEEETRAGPDAQEGERRLCVFSGGGGENFEARYFPFYPRFPAPEGVREEPRLHFCFLDEGRINRDDPEGLSSGELEAVHIAHKIREMIDSGHVLRVREHGKYVERPCRYGDFAVLQRSLSRQYSLERQFRDFGILYNAEIPAGLFSDAPVNDLYSLLRLLVYPEDRIAYAALLRSPFVRLDDSSLTLCLLGGAGAEAARRKFLPFDEALDSLLPQASLEKFRNGRDLYRTLREDARVLSVTEILTRLWYDEGYRYETLWSASSQIYGELFDLFFELARGIDARGRTLADFIDYLEDFIGREERPDDLSVNVERESGVRIMSIHRSKGLEFPVVFVYRAASVERTARNDSAVYYSERWGAALNLPQAEELPSDSGNYFFNMSRDEENSMVTAELRRLLYVAMTRAECELFLTASVPQPPKKKGASPLEADESFRERMIALAAEERNVHSFLDLLLPVLAECEDPPYTVEPVRIHTRETLKSLRRRFVQSAGREPAMEEAAALAAPLYGKASLLFPPHPASLPVPASGLYHEKHTGEEEPPPPGGLDAFLSKTGLRAADFGIIVHAFLDDFLQGREPRIPPPVLSRLDERDWPAASALADGMMKGFLTSPLGKLSLSSARRETEFPFVSAVTLRAGERDRIVPVSGKMDLVFEAEGMIHVVDFKTDRDERPDDHFGQLAVYSRAAGDIFGGRVRPWLFYLRSGRAEDLSGRLDGVDIEKMVSGYLEEQAPP
ncbi:MAG: UvrD-helicase domain-containing protein [Treponema sp.]|jgi:ATP-dependent helicase/nuclease subunit A|nr:UvrD-helicase domain-containing protein [Treponema sp.]